MLEVLGLSKRFGNLEAVKDVSFTVKEGEFISLLGPSGCGKSTLLRCLAGFESLDQGEIRLEGQPIHHRPANQRSFNLVFQRYALFPHLNVFENIAFGLRMKRVSPIEIRSRVLEMLSLVQLSGFESRSVVTLSGGQQQRVALARALVNRPRVLLLDEPLSALDLKLRQQMQVELRRIQRKLGLTFIFVTHDQEEALTLSDRIAVMNQGRVEQIGTAREIYEFPNSEFVARFIGTVNSLDGKVSAMPASPAYGETVLLDVPQAPLKVVLSKPSGRLVMGSPVRLLVRPEKIRLSRGDSSQALGPEANRVSGVVREVLYQGAFTYFWIELPSGESFQVARPNAAHSESEVFAPGDRVVLAWNPIDCMLLDPAEGRVLA